MKLLGRLFAFGFVALAPGALLAQDLTGGCEEIVAKSPDFQSLARIYDSLLQNTALHCSHATLNSCAGPQIDTYWHYRAVDADLMHKAMNAWRSTAKTDGREPIAIVDGLFGPDIEGLLKNKPAMERRTSFGSDLSGHGSQTAQLIGGPEGLGVAPDNPLAAFDVAHPDTSIGKQFADTQAAAKAALDACARGNRVINFSLNEAKTGSNAATTAEELSGLVGDLAHKGCVLVKAAGNDSISDSKTLADYVGDFQIYLSVGATRKSGGVASFSDEGSVYAPGQGIAVKLPPSQLITCDTPRVEAIVRGTSIAAPITTGITAQVVEVLKTAPKFRALVPLEQTRTIVRMVRDSAAAPTDNLNGLRAVRGAMAWAAANGGPPLPPVEKDCGTIPPACVRPQSTTDCATENLCSTAIRSALVLCPERLAKQPVQAFLGAAAVDPWLGLRMIDTLGKGPGKKYSGLLTQLVAQSYNDEFWMGGIAQQLPPYENFDHFLDLFARTRLNGHRTPNRTDAAVMNKLMQAIGSGNRTAIGFWNTLLARPELSGFTMDAARRALIEKRTVVQGGGVLLLESLNRAQGGSPAMGALALDYAKSFPEQELHFFRQQFEALTLGPKRLPNTSAVVDSFLDHADKLDPGSKIQLRLTLGRLLEMNRASEEEVAGWRKRLSGDKG